MASEIWKPVVGYEGLYEVSNLGRVRNLPRFVNSKNGSLALKRGRILGQHTTKKGYVEARLSNLGKTKTFRVNRLVCEAFRGPAPIGCEAAHLDGSRNNNASENLCWKTPLENAADKRRHGTKLEGETAYLTKLTEAEVLAIRAKYVPRYGALTELGREYGVTNAAILAIVQRKNWKHI